MHRTSVFLLLSVAALCAQVMSAQSLFGANLIVNGDAESAAGDPDGRTPVGSIPGWKVTGSPDVLTYASGFGLSASDIAPVSQGNNYFAGGAHAASSSMTQQIDLSSGASTIDAGAVAFAASAYLGGFGSDANTASMTVAFLDGSGKQLSSVTLGPVTVDDRDSLNGMYFRRSIGLLPAKTRSASVTLQMNWTTGTYNDAYADNLSLILNAPANPQSLLGPNLIVDGDAEALPLSLVNSEPVPDVPGWVRTAHFSVDAYSNEDDIDGSSPGPSDRGNNYFYGGNDNALSSAYQDIDISSASSLIDAGAVNFSLSAWLGGWESQDDNAVLNVQFLDWSGNTLDAVTLGPVMSSDRQNVSGLLQESQTGTLPAGVRVVHVLLTMTRTDGSDNDGLADSLSLVLSTGGVGGAVPSIASGGVASAEAFGGSTSIAPGSWIEIYGSNLAPDSRSWAGSDFNGSSAPTSLDGVSVSIGGEQAYVDYINPSQVNVQVPSDLGTGTQTLTVSTANGTSDPYSITVNDTQPGLLSPDSFKVGGTQYVVAILPDGTYVLPPGAVPGINSRPAHVGETVSLYGIGFGSVTPDIPAGQIAGQSNQLIESLDIQFAGTSAVVSYAGLAPGLVGLYQFNVVVPSIDASDFVPVTINLNGNTGTQTLYTSVE